MTEAIISVQPKKGKRNWTDGTITVQISPKPAEGAQYDLNITDCSALWSTALTAATAGPNFTWQVYLANALGQNNFDVKKVWYVYVLEANKPILKRYYSEPASDDKGDRGPLSEATPGSKDDVVKAKKDQRDAFEKKFGALLKAP